MNESQWGQGLILLRFCYAMASSSDVYYNLTQQILYSHF